MLVFFVTGLFAQISYEPQGKIPMDPNVRTGKLANGMTYYIKSNKLPANRAEFYIVTNAGAIQENDSQNGLAHFCEHMCFNGTKNFQKKDIINYLQSIGMKFGPEINAYTVQDETVYTLNKVPIENKANMDTAMMILYDWASNVSFEHSEIDAERGVISEEKRTRENAQFRSRQKLFPILFYGSKYAERDVIGKLDVIQKAPYDTLIQFYKDWYRPDLQAVIIVGDFDASAVEAKVKSMFSSIPARKNVRTRETYFVPNHKETLAEISLDKEATTVSFQMFIKHDAPTNRDMKYYRDQYSTQLYSIMLNNRLGELAQDANPPYTFGYAAYGGLIRTKEAYISMAGLNPDKMKDGIQALARENQRVLQFGFTATELERAKKQMLTSNEKQFNERDKQSSDEIAGKLQDLFLTNEPYPTHEWDFDYAKMILNQISLEEINGLAKEWMTDENRVMFLTGPEKETIKYPTKDEMIAWYDGVKTEKLSAYVDKVANRPLIAKEPTAGTIIKETKDAKNGVTRWELSNGVKVVIKPTNFKSDEILMSAQSLGGQSIYDLKDEISANYAATIVDMSGVGDFDNIELQKMLSGKNANVSPFIGQLTEGFRGNSSVNDFETMLQLNYLYFTQPRADKNAFESFMTRTKSQLKNKSLDPTNAFRDSMTVTMAQHNPRKRPMTAEMLDEAKLARIKFIFSDRFGDPSGFTYYFVGNINADSAKPLILKYLGGLPVVKRTETFRDLGIRMPKANVTNAYQRKLENPKATVFMAFTGDFNYKIEERLLLDAVAEYLSIRMTETLREEVGGTYGASVWSAPKKFPASEYSLNIYFDTDPAKLDTMIAVVYREVNKLMAEGPDATHIKDIIENKLKEHVENVKDNEYWMSVLSQDDYNQEQYINFDYEKFWKTLTPKAVQKATKKYISTNRVVKVVTSSNEIKM